MPEKDDRPGETGFRQIPGRSLVMLRGDLGDTDLAARLASAIGAELPRAGQIVRKGGVEVAWMSPDELLVMPAKEASKTVDAVNKALKGLHVLVADVSDMRVEFEISGPVRDILAKGTPSDMSPGSFGIGDFPEVPDRPGSGRVLAPGRCHRSYNLQAFRGRIPGPVA